jgi:hypothetical protein
VILRNIERIKCLEQKGEGYGLINSETGRSSLGAVSESDEIGTTREDEDSMMENLAPLDLDWADFNTDFHSSCPNAKSDEFTKINHIHGSKVVDLRPYMVPRPFTVFENDTF